MGIFKVLSRLLKGERHAGTVEERVSGGDGRERRVLHPVPAVCERTLSDIRGIRVLAAACADERGRDSGAMPQDPLCRESRALIAADDSVVNELVYAVRSITEAERRLVMEQQAH